MSESNNKTKLYNKIINEVIKEVELNTKTNSSDDFLQIFSKNSNELMESDLITGDFIISNSNDLSIPVFKVTSRGDVVIENDLIINLLKTFINSAQKYKRFIYKFIKKICVCIYNLKNICNKIKLNEVEDYDKMNANNIKSNYLKLCDVQTDLKLCDVEENNVKTNDLKLCEVEENDVKTNDLKLCEVEENDVKTNDLKLYEVEENDVKTNDLKLCEVEENDAKTNDLK